MRATDHKELMQDPDLLRDSIEALSEGLAIYGPDCRLVTCNRRYAEMLHPVTDMIVPGVLWPDVLRACVDRGVYANPPEDVEAWLEEVAREPLMQERDLEVAHTDGSVYSISHRPTSFGGFVITRTDITERRRAEAMIRDREALLTTILDTIPVAIVMARAEDGRIVYRSREAEREFPESFEFAQDYFVEQAQRFEYVEALRRHGKLSDYRVDFRRDGKIYQASLSGRIVEYGYETYVVSAISDISERLSKEELLRHVVEACPTPLMMTRLESGEVLFSSPEARALFGDPETSKVLYVEDGAREAYVEELRRRGAVHEHKVQLQKQSGERFWSASSSRVIRYRGEDVIVAHMRDLTGQMSIEEELAEQRELMFQNEKLSAMGELLAGVAHELNNPLSVVLGRAQLLLDLEGVPPEVRRQSEQINTAAERCARIVRTFLTMARQQPAHTAPSSINEIVQTATGVARYGDSANRARIETELAEGLPPVEADSDQITQVILNLLLNAEQAIRGSGKGSRILVRTRLGRTGDAVLVEVEDDGPGVPDELRGRIFEPFFTTKDVGEGTGIGLALSHRIMQSHGGEIRLDGAFRGGSLFRIKLPLSDGKKADDAGTPEGGKALPARILVVDDEPDVAAINGEILSRNGYEVDVTNSAGEALARLRERSYDLVVSDLNMPGIDGRGLFDAISAEFPELRSRTAFLTGDTMGSTSQAFLREVGRPFLEKPVSPRELCAFVAEQLAATGAEAR